jgi:hypothetical protein
MNEEFGKREVQWIVDKQFAADDGLTVQVNKLPLRWPRFSIIVGILRVNGDEQSVSRYMPIMSAGRGQGKIVINPIASKLMELLTQAQDYIQSELQRLEDSALENKIAWEEKSLNKDKPRPRVGLSGGPNSGKTAKRREAKKGKAS